MSQGYLYRLTIDGRTMPFKRLRVRATSGKIDTSCKLNPDNTVNAGHTSTDGDLKTVFISFYELLGDNDATTDVLTFQEGERYDLAWLVTYNGVSLYGGSSFYYSENDLAGSIPGEGACDFSLESNGPYTKY